MSACFSSAISTLGVTSNDEVMFKKPLQPAPRKKKKVLDEDIYLQHLESIIEEDFYPELENTKDKLEYLEAKEEGNMAKLREIHRKYSMGHTPVPGSVENSPATFETPDHTPVGQKLLSQPDRGSAQNKWEPAKEEERHLNCSKSSKKLSLDQFMATHTSEDNENFEELMKESERRYKLKHAWLFEAEEKHKKYEPNLVLPSVEAQTKAAQLAITATCEEEKDTRSKQAENWTYKTFNAIMYVPEKASISKEKRIELAKQKSREIVHSNTRYESSPFNETVSQATVLEASAIQASKLEGKVGVDGKELSKDSPLVNGYGFVGTPSPVPGVDASPLMTWGEVEGTPFQLDGSQTPLLHCHTGKGPSYRMPKVPDRDEIAKKLAEKASQTHRDRKEKALSVAKSSLNTPAANFGKHSSMERLTSMSPAAQRLFNNKLGLRKCADTALRESYSPVSSARSRSDTASTYTPKLISSPAVSGQLAKKAALQNKTTNEESPHITDNLLNLPTKLGETKKCKATPFKRQCAADFF